MNSKKLTPEKRGVLKGVLGTSLVFSVGIGIGAFFLHQRHEDELDKLERDTARDCLDFAAEHYEKVLRRKNKESAKGCYEASTEEWEELEKKLEERCKEYDRLVREINTQNAQYREELAKLKSKIYAENDLLNEGRGTSDCAQEKA